MGVRGLQTFMEKGCPESCKTVSIEELARAHRQKFNCNPVLAVDGYSMVNRLYCNSNLEWVYGGQWLQFVNLLKYFIAKFESIGVELIFFFDGTVCHSKMEMWVQRRLAKYATIASIFDSIQRNRVEPDRKDFQLPTSMGILAAFALKVLGANVNATEREADDVIAEYAFKHNEVFAILSQDSDFIIYNTKDYLSMNNLDLNTLQTRLYDRKCLASRYLNMNVDQLPLFASLAGNDYISFDKLRPFHRELMKNKQNSGCVYLASIAPHLSRIIQGKQWRGNATNDREVYEISQFVFRSTDWVQLIRESLNSYNVTKDAPFELEPVIRLNSAVEKGIHNRQPNTYLFNILCKMEYRSSEVLEDEFFFPSALTYREIRQRCYGVLFNCFPFISSTSGQQQDLAVREWCAYFGNRMEKPELVKPLPLKRLASVSSGGQVPALEVIWFGLSELEKTKMFWAILEVPMEFEALISLPKDRIFVACILNYLISDSKMLGSKNGPHVQPWEVAVFIAQAVWRKNIRELEQLMVPWVETRAVSLASLFMRGVTTLLMVLDICDNPFPVECAMPWNYFDGKLFHYLYTSFKEPARICDLFINQTEALAEFYKLLPIAVNNTVYDVKRMDWRSCFVDFDYQRFSN